MRILAIFVVCALVLGVVSANASGDPRRTMASVCGCGLWHEEEKHADKVPPLFYVRGDSRDAWLRMAEPVHMTLNAQFAKRWWQAESATAMYITGSTHLSVGVQLRAFPDCPPGVPAAKCRSFPVEGRLTITRPSGAKTFKVAGRCGC